MGTAIRWFIGLLVMLVLMVVAVTVLESLTGSHEHVTVLIGMGIGWVGWVFLAGRIVSRRRA